MTNNYSLQNNNNIFSTFPSYELKRAESYSASIVKENKPDELVIYDGIAASEIKKSKRRKIVLGSTLATTIVTAGIAGLFLAKGFHGSSLKKFSKSMEKITKELQRSGAASKDVSSKTVYYTRKGAKKTYDTMQASSNFTAMKDWIADKAFRTNKFTTKFADASKNFFKKIVDKALGKKYDKVEIKVKDLTSLLKHYNLDELSALKPEEKLKKVTIKGKTLTVQEWINLLKKETNRLETNFDKSFSLGARRVRNAKRNNSLSGLKDKIGERFFKDKKSLFNPENYKTYATEDLTKVAQEELKDEILKAKRNVSNNITTIHDGIKTSLNSVSMSVNPEDEVSKQIVKQLKSQLEAFKNCAGSEEVKARETISKNIVDMVDDLIASTNGNTIYTNVEQQEIVKLLDSIKKDVASTGVGSKGALEEIMTILNGLNQAKISENGRKIISDSSYKEFSKLSKQISKGLDKATELETGEYFLKQAELEVGSAATDVLSILFPIGVGAYAVASGDDKDEKISATLTTCIPLVGTFATFVYGTTKMLSGAKNLAFSLLSGAALSKLGNYCDKLYKKYKDSGSVVNVVKDEYDNFVSDITPKYAAQPLKENKK